MENRFVTVIGNWILCCDTLLRPAVWLVLCALPLEYVNCKWTAVSCTENGSLWIYACQRNFALKSLLIWNHISYILNFLIIKPIRCTNFSNLFWNDTLHVSDSPSVHHQELFAVHTAMVYVIQVCRQLAGRTRMDLSYILILREGCLNQCYWNISYNKTNWMH